MTTPNNPTDTNDLRAVQIAFLEALEQGEPPAAWLRRYPQYAQTLTDLALTVAAPATDPTPADIAHAEGILRSALQARTLAQPAPRLAERVKARGLSMREVAARVRLTSDILFKIDRRVIPVDTVPARLLDQLGQVLGCTADALRAGLAGSAPPTAGAMYHAKQAPTVGQQPFADAVRTSVALPAADRAYWLDEK
jgi:hypothetical protein